MAAKTGIEWTDATWNPIRGCTRVSEGCRLCYAESVAYRFSGPGQPYEGLVRIGADGTRKPEWNGTVRFVEDHLLDPLRWKTPRRVFVNSMSDLFHEGVTDAMLDRIFAVMALCPQHTFQVLTKRPERMLAYSAFSHSGSCLWIGIRQQIEAMGYPDIGAVDKVLPNVWLGVSAENQPAADKRIPLLCDLGKAGWQTMVSFEPLLSGIVAPERWLRLGGRTWAIVGGENGKGEGIRPMHPAWARSLRDQCVAAGVPFFFKQWGEWAHGSDGRWASIVHLDGVVGARRFGVNTPAEEPDNAAVMQRVGKKAAGDLLDGVQWHQFPEAR